MQEIDLDTVVFQRGDLYSGELDGEMVMMSVEHGKYYGLDEIGSRIWKLIEQPRSVSEICELLVAEFQVEREKCRQDVLDFLNKLAREDLVKVDYGTTE